MLFHSFSFLIFSSLFLVGFALLRGRARLLFTLFASYFFYGWWNPSFVIFLAGFTLYGYFAAEIPQRAHHLFPWFIAIAFLPLLFFKYGSFLVANLEILLQHHFPIRSDLKLPLGISFMTFTIVAYLVDVQRGKIVAERNFAKFALYISFFPHLIAGPIMRPKELLPQFKHLEIRGRFVKIGLLLFAIGLLKKVVFADALAPIVDVIYANSAQVDLPHALLAFYAFAIQIYCDFSGYTDMAVGIAFVIGIWLPLNFNRPYLACSIRDFWRRWHITLSRWLRDYLYIPLGGNRHGYRRMVAALMITMLLGGLWHGAAWTFVFWGLLHGIFLVLEAIFKRKFVGLTRLPRWLKQLATFHLVAFSWIFFRAPSWTDAMNILRGFGIYGDWRVALAPASFPIILILLYFLIQRWDRVSISVLLTRRLSGAVVYAIAVTIILGSIVLSAGSPNRFIYFDF